MYCTSDSNLWLAVTYIKVIHSREIIWTGMYQNGQDIGIRCGHLIILAAEL